MGEGVGLSWYSNTLKTRATDGMLQICIGDGLIPTKIDGWIHACTLTAKAMAKYAADPDAGLDIVGITSWSGGNSALRYARWQADFHWRIDTRPWQFFLFMYTMKWAFRDNIQEFKSLSQADKDALLELNDRFWEVVACAYSYRSEAIERSRRFAPHPDPTCGANWQGYPYRKIWDRDDPSFEELALPFIEKGSYEEGRGTEGKAEPRPFPAICNQVEQGLPTIALLWLRETQTRSLCDAWLRVKLGDRWVPTRFNGWSSSLSEVLRFLEPYAAAGRVAPENGEERGLDIGDYAIRFAVCQCEFYRRLNGRSDQLIGLIDAARSALKDLVATKGLPESKADEFVDKAIETIRKEGLSAGCKFDTERLPELNVVRPLHPRFAPEDPLEPLPWQVANTERYLNKMAALGYTI